jgi:hypothetical protein
LFEVGLHAQSPGSYTTTVAQRIRFGALAPLSQARRPPTALDILAAGP